MTTDRNLADFQANRNRGRRGKSLQSRFAASLSLLPGPLPSATARSCGEQASEKKVDPFGRTNSRSRGGKEGSKTKSREINRRRGASPCGGAKCRNLSAQFHAGCAVKTAPHLSLFWAQEVPGLPLNQQAGISALRRTHGSPVFPGFTPAFSGAKPLGSYAPPRRAAWSAGWLSTTPMLLRLRNIEVLRRAFTAKSTRLGERRCRNFLTLRAIHSRIIKREGLYLSNG